MAQYDSSILRLPAVYFVHFDPDADTGRPYPHKSHGIVDPYTLLVPALIPEAFSCLRLLSPIEILPPPDYDWVGALRERLRGGNQNSVEFMNRRAAAREQEKKDLYGRLPKVEPEFLQCVWEEGMKWRDRFDWNLGE